MRGHHMTPHYIMDITEHKKSHHIKWHDMTWHLATNHITSPHVTSQPTTLLHLTPQPTTSKQVTTSPPWNGWRLVHSKNSVWASQWLATLCTFYRQILSLAYSFFLFETSAPGLPGSTCIWYMSLNAIAYHDNIVIFSRSKDIDGSGCFLAFTNLTQGIREIPNQTTIYSGCRWQSVPLIWPSRQGTADSFTIQAIRHKDVVLLCCLALNEELHEWIHQTAMQVWLTQPKWRYLKVWWYRMTSNEIGWADELGIVKKFTVCPQNGEYSLTSYTLLPLSHIRESHDTRRSPQFVASSRYNPWCQKAGELLPNPAGPCFHCMICMIFLMKIMKTTKHWSQDHLSGSILVWSQLKHALFTTREVLPTHSAREVFLNDQTPFPQFQYKWKATITLSKRVKKKRLT